MATLYPKYSHTGVGSVTRDIVDRLSDFVSILDYGADPTGVADSSAALQSCIDNSLCVYIPVGTFKINSTIFWRPGITIIGASKTGSILNFSNVTGPCFTSQLNRWGASFTVQGLRDAYISRIKFVGNVNDATNHIFNSDHGWHRNQIENCWFYSCGADAIHLNCDNNYGGFYNVFSHNTFGDASDFSTGADTTLIKGDCIYATGSCNENTVANNVFWRPKGNGIHLVGTLTWTIQRWTIRGNGVEWAGYSNTGLNRYGVLIEGNSQRMSIAGNYFEGNGGGNTSVSGGGIKCDNSALDVGITENLFANQTYDINLNSVFNANIVDNTFISGVSGFNIRVFSVATINSQAGQVRIGHNPNFNNTASKFLSVATPSLSQVYGDPVVARYRGNSALWGKFTPRLYGGTTEISCSSAIGVYERVDDMLMVDVSLTVSNVNSATGALVVYGSDGNTGKIPGLASSIGYTSRNDAGLTASIGIAQISNVTLGTGYTSVVALMNQSGADAILLRKNGSAQADVALDASAIVVGSIVRFRLSYYI